MRFAITMLALAACVKSNKITCGDLTCPPQYTCDLANDRCISPDQIAACNGLADGTDCVVAGAPGTCAGGVCDPLVCGDGLVSGAEQCDGANLAGQTCRDFHFYDDAGLACTSACTFDTSHCTGFCGDGIVNGGELCDGAPPPLGACFDFGYDAGPLGCGSACGASFDECARFGWRVEAIGNIQPFAGGGTGHDDAWLVGTGGAISHYNGVVWALDASPVTTDLLAVWAIAPGDAWAVGPSVVLHRDATQWQVVAAPAADFADVWAASDTAVFTATRDHQVQWWNGTAWQQLGTLGSGATVIRGTSANDLWVVRTNNTLAHWNGTAWSPATLAGSVYSVAAVAPDDVWAVGLDASFAGLIAHWDGSSWTTWTDPAAQYASVAAFGPVDAWVVETGGNALHWDGATWANVPVTIDNASAALVALEPGEMIAVEYTGYAYRYTGQAFARYNTNNVGTQTALWSASGTDMFVAVSKFILRRAPTTLWPRSFTEPFGETIEAIAGASAQNLWALSADHLYHFDGTSWTEQPNPGVPFDFVLWAGASDVWTFSNGAAHHGPAPWTDYSVGTMNWLSVSGSSSNDVWGIQNDGVPILQSSLYHWDGTAWQQITLPAPTPAAVAALAANDVFVSTVGLHVLHWDGTTWSDTPVTTLHPLTFFAAVAPDDVFAASDLDLVHFDGTRWSRVRLDLDTTIINNAIDAIFAPTAGHIQIAFRQSLIRDLIRSRPWVCRAHETNCSDGIDDDCDGKTDHEDPDCP